MDHDIFVSYASPDRAQVYRIVDYLESCGMRCWFAPRDVAGGRNYAEAILTALTEAPLFLLFFSEKSNGSEHVQREVERALHLSKPMVPVRLCDTLPTGAMDYYLATLHWIDGFLPSEGGKEGDGIADGGDETACEDVARAAATVLGRQDEIRDTIVARRQKRDQAAADEKRRKEELEMRLRLEAEASAKTDREEENRRRAELEEREIEQKRKRKDERRAKEEKEKAAAAAETKRLLREEEEARLKKIEEQEALRKRKEDELEEARRRDEIRREREKLREEELERQRLHEKETETRRNQREEEQREREQEREEHDRQHREELQKLERELAAATAAASATAISAAAGISTSTSRDTNPIAQVVSGDTTVLSSGGSREVQSSRRGGRMPVAFFVVAGLVVVLLVSWAGRRYLFPISAGDDGDRTDPVEVGLASPTPPSPSLLPSSAAKDTDDPVDGGKGDQSGHGNAVAPPETTPLGSGSVADMIDAAELLGQPMVKPDAKYATVRVRFEWQGEVRFLTHPEVLKISPDDIRKVRLSEWQDDRLTLLLADGSDGISGVGRSGEKAEPENLEIGFELAIPGFEVQSERVILREGTVYIDFAPLQRLRSAVEVRNAYEVVPRAAEAHTGVVKAVELRRVGAMTAADYGIEGELPGQVDFAKWLDELLGAGTGEPVVQTVLPPADGSQVLLEEGRYRAELITNCAKPFERIVLSEFRIAKGGEEAPPTVDVPIVPLGVFGGETNWTSTINEAGTDEEGTVTWTLYNLPNNLDFPDAGGPRVVQSYRDFVNDGNVLRKFYLPAPVTEVSYLPEQGRWRLRADPVPLISKLTGSPALLDRYYESIEFDLTYHGDTRGIVFDAGTRDQPLNSTDGTVREFAMKNAYPVFAQSVPDLSREYPGFGILDMNRVFEFLHENNEENAIGFRDSATVPVSVDVPLAIDLGIEPDLSFAGSESVRIDAVDPRSPADEAGLKPGDLITDLGGEATADLRSFYRIRFSLQPGVATEVKILRAGESSTLVLTPVPR